MDSTTQLGASSSSSSTHSWRYDVFLSFRAADTRRSFADDLYSNLHQNGIKTFIDDVSRNSVMFPTDFRSGEEISPTLHKVIEESRISIILFSENYAFSPWCLDELVNILQCKESKQQIVWPIFYKVDPSDAKYQKGNFGKAFGYLEHMFDDNIEKVNRWRTALTEAAHLPGWCFLDEHQGKFINHIVEKISVQVLNRTYLTVAKYPVGLESRIQDMDELLGVGVNDVRLVGIWGAASGIGKTTLAKAIYNSIAHKFEGSCFLKNVSKNSMRYGGLVRLQKILLSQVLGEEILEVTNVDREANIVIKKLLSGKRILLIFDDVDQLEHLKKLIGEGDWFALGSRIIITTGDKNVLTAHRVIPSYEVKKFDHSEALELFSWNTFHSGRIPEGFSELANMVLGYAQGLPLLLTAMSSLLCGARIDQWQALLDISRLLTENHGTKEDKSIEEMSAKSFSKTISAECAFLFIGLCLEILSLAFDQASSPSKPHYALFGMLMAIAALFTCICELIYKESVRLKRWGVLWWFYHLYSRNLRFGTLPEIYGLVGGMVQCACSIVQYVYFRRHAENPIKVSLGPAIFLICLGASRLSENRKEHQA